MIVAVPDAWLDPGSLSACGVDVATLLSKHRIVAYPTRASDWSTRLAGSGAEALLTISNRVTAGDLDSLPALRIVSVPGTGIGDYVDVPAASARGVLVCNVRDYATDAIAEFTLALLLMTTRRIALADQAVRAGAWHPDHHAGFELRGRRAAVIGYGNIGRRVSQLLSSLGVTVQVVSRHARDADLPAGASRHDLHEALAAAELVTLHASLDATTLHILDAAAFAAMRPGAVLVNTARGGLVHTAALVASLRSGRLAGAALDVFEEEPLPANHALRKLPNVILTPHMAGGSREARRRVVKTAVSNVLAFASGHPVNVVAAPGSAS